MPGNAASRHVSVIIRTTRIAAKPASPCVLCVRLLSWQWWLMHWGAARAAAVARATAHAAATEGVLVAMAAERREGGGGLGRCYRPQDLVLGRGASFGSVPTRSDEDHARVRESMKSNLRSMVSCRGLRQRAYIRRILCGTQSVLSVGFASNRRRSTPPTGGRTVAEVAYVPPRKRR